MDEYKRRRRRSRAVMSMFLDSLGGSIDNVDVATFDSDGTDLKALVVGIEPIQDLHGYDNPWPPGGGKNLINQLRAITGSYTNTYFREVSVNAGDISAFHLVAGQTYTLSCDVESSVEPFRISVGCGNGGNSSDIATSEMQNNGRIKITFSATESKLTQNGDIFAFRVPRFDARKTFTFTISNIQLEVGSTATSYAPYSNICPISGHSSVNVIVSPTLNPLDGTITNIPLGGTCYGGQLDVLPGVLMDTNANIASYNGETINEPWISSMDAYSPGATPTIGAQVVYPLSTPQTIQLTGQQIATFLGTNNVWCDSGKIIHLEY